MPGYKEKDQKKEKKHTLLPALIRSQKKQTVMEEEVNDKTNLMYIVRGRKKKRKTIKTIFFR